MKRIALALATALAVLPTGASAQPAQDVLTLESAIELAMQQQPSLRQTRASIDASHARVDLARVARRPTVTLQGTLGTGSPREAACPPPNDNLTCGGFLGRPDLSTGLSASASWRLYDFGQTGAAIRAAELSAEAATSTLVTSELEIRTNVEVAYLEAVARARLVTVADTTVKSEEVHLDQARKFVAAQAKDPIEVSQAQARAANARSALAQAQSAQAIAIANLRAAIGWLDASRSPVVANEWPIPPEQEPPALPALVENARKQRPEITQLDKEIEAAEANFTAARYERRPVLSANASTQWTPQTDNWSPEPSWSAGLTLSWQLFDGGRSDANQRIARANVTAAQAERDTLLVSLTSQLELSRAQIVSNRANVVASNEAVTAARAQLRLAEARYTQGLGSQIELADAQQAVTLAEGNLITAQWQLADAWAQLRRAIGQR